MEVEEEVEVEEECIEGLLQRARSCQDLMMTTTACEHPSREGTTHVTPCYFEHCLAIVSVYVSVPVSASVCLVHAL